MLVPYSTVAVPEIESFSELAPMLERMTGSGLPLFVIRNAGAKSEDVLEGCSPTLETAGFQATLGREPLNYVRHSRIMLMLRLQNPNDPFSPKGASYNDLRLHMDGIPNPNGDTISTLALHHTSHGAATASFFVPTDAFVADETKDINLGANGIMDFHFLDGHIDDKILEPEAHVVEIEEKDLLIFRIGGKKPLAHKFLTTSKKRSSRVSTARASRAN